MKPRTLLLIEGSISLVFSDDGIRVAFEGESPVLSPKEVNDMVVQAIGKHMRATVVAIN